MNYECMHCNTASIWRIAGHSHPSIVSWCSSYGLRLFGLVMLLNTLVLLIAPGTAQVLVVLVIGIGHQDCMHLILFLK